LFDVCWGFAVREWRELRVYFRALADTRRLRIVSELTHSPEVSMKELSVRLRASQPLVSWHLRVLVRCGLVQTRKQGRLVFCSINRPAFINYQERLVRLLAESQADAMVLERDDGPLLLPQPPPLSAGL
jgi:ArsR family transcriptional regulator, arsenate/arsenite/antimonite-responsive transcriptional repressor